MSDLLRISLSAAVPLHAAELKRLPWSDVAHIAGECSQTIAEKGDVLQFGGKGGAAAFNALARGLAALSFAPGGVNFLGDHYEDRHPESADK